MHKEKSLFKILLIFRQSHTTKLMKRYHFCTYYNNIYTSQVKQLNARHLKGIKIVFGFKFFCEVHTCNQLAAVQQRVLVLPQCDLNESLSFGFISFGIFHSIFSGFLLFRIYYKLPTALNNYRNELNVTHSSQDTCSHPSH